MPEKETSIIGNEAQNGQNVIGPEGQDPIILTPEEKPAEVAVEVPENEAGEVKIDTAQAVENAFAGNQEAGVGEGLVAEVQPVVPPGEIKPDEAQQLKEIENTISELTNDVQNAAAEIPAEPAVAAPETAVPEIPLPTTEEMKAEADKQAKVEAAIGGAPAGKKPWWKFWGA